MLVLSTLTALAALFAFSLFASNTSKTFDVSAGGQLIVETDIGSISITTGSGDRVEATVTASGNNAERFKAGFSQDGDTVTITGDYEKSSLWGWNNNPKVRFEITVPERFDVDLKTAGGSITVADLDGEVRAKTSGGSLNFGNIDGPVYGRTSGGSITLEGGTATADVRTSGGSISIGNVGGEVSAKTSGGSIKIASARGSVDAETSGGSIKVEEVMGTINASTSGGSITAYISEQPGADCRLTTSGGGVTAYLADGISVDIDARASGGKVQSDFEVDSASLSKSRLTGELNGGGPRLEMRTSGGGVKIARR